MRPRIVNPRSGVPATQLRRLAAFGVVELAGSNDVAIRVGGRQSVVVHGDDNLLRHVTTSVRGDDLVIGTTPGSFTTRSSTAVTRLTSRRMSPAVEL